MKVLRLRFQSEPADRFIERMAAIRASIDALPDATVRAILAELETARQQVLVELAGLAPEGYPAYRLRDLEGRLHDVMDRFVDRYQRTVDPVEQALGDLGGELAARPLVDAGLMFHVPQIARGQVEIAHDYHASLIRGLADEAVAAISQDLRIGLLRGEPLWEVIGRIAGSLDSPATFGDIATRAEAITRTELGRIQARATQKGLEETARFVPDLEKQWRHSGNTGPRARLGHIEADGQRRSVDETFRVRESPKHPYEDLDYPRDPTGSPGNTIFCGCLSVPYREAWADAIAAAQQDYTAEQRRREEAA